MERLTEKLFPVSVKTVDGTKSGYINRSGRIRISPVYDQADDYQKNGLAIVTLNGRQGLLNSFGRFVVKPEYESIQPFSEGIAVVQMKNGYRLMNEAGRILTKKKYPYIGQFKNGRALFQMNDLFGFLDEHGQEVIPAIYKYANDYEEGKAIVQTKEDLFILIDQSGNMLHTYPFPYVGQLSEGLLSFKKQDDGKEGYISESGQIVIEPAYDTALPFEGEVAIIGLNTEKGYQYGLINKQGNILFKPVYDEVRILGEGTVALGKAVSETNPFISRYAVAKTSGEQLTDFIFSDIGPFRKQLASASNGENTFFIRPSGKRAKEYPTFRGAGTVKLDDRLISIYMDNRLRYANEKGEFVWHPDDDVVLRSPYRVIEKFYKPNKAYAVYYPEISGITNQVEQQEINGKLAYNAGVRPVASEEAKERTYNGDYNILFFKKHLVVIEQNGYSYPYGAAHGMPSIRYSNIDLRNGHDYRLSELFKADRDYTIVLSKLVEEQIKQNPDNYFLDQYKGVDRNQPFYVDDEALYLVFDVYAIAPYVMGFPKFRIKFAEIEPLIDHEGAFWNAFHMKLVDD